MNQKINRQNVLYRLLEIIPGFLSWVTILLMCLASRFLPAIAAIFIIFFDVYWLLKTVYLSFHLRSAFRRMRENLKIDWLDKLKNLHPAADNRQKVVGRGSSTFDWHNIYHLIILPTSKEPYEILKESFTSLTNANYPKEKMLVILAAEERGGDAAREIARKIQNEFGQKFLKFLATFHPANLPGEIPGKGSNETWAAKEAKNKIIDLLNINYENILVSVFDADTQIPKDYFSRLTYAFLTCKKPQRSSFQPIPLFTNNIYQAPALARIIAFSATFWHMMQQERPEKLTTFSSHSMPWKALVEIGFWNTDIVSEDSQIFWQCFLHYDGDWRVEPLFYPVMMDANVAPTFWETIKNIYKQQRRWAWGAENIPYLLYGFRKNKKIPPKTKWYWAFHKIEGFHSWATNAILIFALGWLPIILGGPAFDLTILAYKLPIITRWIMTFAMVGIASSAILGIILLPPKPAWFKKRHYFLYLAQWIFIPFTLIIFGSIPALEAQTRLMLGGKFRLGFWITPKHRDAAQK